jgi:LysR family transcriptional regulator, regulator for genes of the gallate degradation pathway
VLALLSLHHLHVFTVIAAHGGVRRAAEAMFRTPSALARSVATLEVALGTALFERKDRGMLLTADGQLALARMRRIQVELSEVRTEALRLRGSGVSAIDALFNESRLQVAALLADVHHMPTVARRLGISQAAVSAALGKLEATLAQPLFHRSARGMMPTDVGTRWITRFERSLAELRHIEADIAAARGELRGVVTLGALPLIRTSVLPQAIGSVLARHPHLRVVSLESPYEELVGQLLSGRVDFIVGALRPTPGSQLVTESLFVDRMALLAGARHPLAKRRRVAVQDLAAYPWVLSRAGTPLRDALEAYFASEGCPMPQPAVETGDLALVRGLLVHGDMVAPLSEHQMRYEVDTGSLVVLPLPMKGLQREIGITTRTGAQLPPGAIAVLNEVRRLSAGLSAR